MEDAIVYIGETNEGTDVWMMPADGSAAGEADHVAERAREMVRWDGATGSLLVSGRWKEDELSLRRISLGGKAGRADRSPGRVRPATTIATFDVSFDGRLVVYSREKDVGNIWVHEAKKGTF